MTKLVLMATFSLLPFLAACTNAPHGRWEVIERVEIFRVPDDSLELAFRLEVGEVCAMSDDWKYAKAFGYKEVVCKLGQGWAADVYKFKRID